MITEKFISYLWMFQKFDRRALSTSQGDRIEVLSVGVLNRDAGADFTRARLLIDGMEWVGDIEIHVRSSDWKKHGHRSNAAYNSVILQVVWEKDEEVFREDQSVVPTLELCRRVAKDELEKWEKFIENPSAIACASHWKNVDASVKQTMLHKALEERMYRKALAVLQMFAETQHDWDETAYRWVASSFGFKVNNQPFEMLAKAVPLKVLQHHADRLVSIEALLFGQSGLLPLRDEAQDAYVEELYREYRFLAHKFQLSAPVAAHTWKFARIRPANFPTVRIAQLACFLHRYPRFFSMLLETTDLRSLQKLFLEIQVSPYWQHHYQFFKKTDQKTTQLGKDSINLLITNAVIPLLVAYGQVKNQPNYLERCLEFLRQMSPEKNHLTSEWEAIGVSMENAAHAQAFLELFQQYCQPKRCLACEIGVSILQS